MGLAKKRKGSSQSTDEQIIDLYWKRDEEAIALTARVYGRCLYGIVYNLLHDDCDAEEAVNDTYLDAWNSIPPARPACLLAFLTRIARSNAITAYHRRTRSRCVPPQMVVSLSELDGVLGSESDDPLGVETQAISKAISDYLRRQPPRARHVFIYRYYCSDTVKRIAGMLRISESTVNRELARMREELREYLEKEGIYV